MSNPIEPNPTEPNPTVLNLWRDLEAERIYRDDIAKKASALVKLIRTNELKAESRDILAAINRATRELNELLPRDFRYEEAL